MLRLITLASVLASFLMTTSAFSQLVQVKGIVTDTISHPYGMKDRFRVIVNDTVFKAIPVFAVPLNKKKTAKAMFMARYKQFLLDQKRHDSLWRDKRFVVVPDSTNRFEITVRLSDSLTFTSPGFVTQKDAVKNLMKLDSIHIKLKPKPCEPIIYCNDKNPKLYVFIAQKIDAKYSAQNYCPENGSFRIPMDSRYKVKYKILKNVYGDYKKDTIDFTAFDHYGTPKFLSYKYVMLFVSDHCGKMYHEKYQYFDVYPTEDGRWARPGNPYQVDRMIPPLIEIENIKFKDHLSFDISNEYEHIIKEKYPEPYFRITEDKAYPVTGVYSESLFLIKKNGILKARFQQ